MANELAPGVAGPSSALDRADPVHKPMAAGVPRAEGRFSPWQAVSDHPRRGGVKHDLRLTPPCRCGCPCGVRQGEGRPVWCSLVSLDAAAIIEFSPQAGRGSGSGPVHTLVRPSDAFGVRGLIKYGAIRQCGYRPGMCCPGRCLTVESQYMVYRCLYSAHHVARRLRALDDGGDRDWHWWRCLLSSSVTGLFSRSGPGLR
jgi:hypothetical protein